MPSNTCPNFGPGFSSGSSSRSSSIGSPTNDRACDLTVLLLPLTRGCAWMLLRLTNAAERENAWMFFARVGVMRALKRHDIRQFNPDRKDHHWDKRKLKRDEG